MLNPLILDKILFKLDFHEFYFTFKLLFIFNFKHIKKNKMVKKFYILSNNYL